MFYFFLSQQSCEMIKQAQIVAGIVFFNAHTLIEIKLRNVFDSVIQYYISKDISFESKYILNVCIIFRLDLNMELPQGQTGSVGTSVASAEQVLTFHDILVLKSVHI